MAHPPVESFSHICGTRLRLHAFISKGLGYHAFAMNWKLRGYLKETRRPVYSAALILPFLCIYHAGTIVLHTTHINGADALIIRILSLFSVHSMLGSALVLVICFYRLAAALASKLENQAGNASSLFSGKRMFCADPAVCLRLAAYASHPCHECRPPGHFRPGALLRSRESTRSLYFEDFSSAFSLRLSARSLRSRKRPRPRPPSWAQCFFRYFTTSDPRETLSRSEVSSSDSSQVSIFPSFL